MSGSMYDLNVATYSPEGRIYQVEYATKAVESSETVIGVKCKDGILLAAEKQKFSRLLVDGTNRRIYNLDASIGVALCGKLPDARFVFGNAKEEGNRYEEQFGVPITGQVLANRVGFYVHNYTLYAGLRPLGATLFIASHNPFDEFELHMVEPSGNCYSYHACAHGKGRSICKSEFERRNFKNLTCKEALVYAAKMLILSHEEFKDKKFEYEMTWITQETQYQHQNVPKNLIDAAVAEAEKLIEQDQMGE